MKRRDWLTGLSAGALLGFVILGVGSRIGMRYLAVAAGQSPAFTVEGSIAVSLLGALTGAIMAALFLLLRVILPRHRWIRAALFWGICGALALRGIRPVTMLKAGVFLPLFLIHGALLHMWWGRARRTVVT